jgi:NAD(P)H dehydrogenase (quinone)
MTSAKKILVTGASGKLGTLVLKGLLKNQKNNIIATTRNPENLSNLAKEGIEVRTADFNDPKNLANAFIGADRLLLISTDAIGSRIEQHKNAIAAAKESGVKHIIYTSWPKPNTSVAVVAKEHLETENLIKASGLSYTILRNLPYAENIFYSIPNAIAMGTLYGAAGSGKVAYVTKQDCADAAVGALLSNNYTNTIVDITGPEAISHFELAKIISEVTGKNVNYVDLPEIDFKNGLLKSGMPELWAEVFAKFDVSYKNLDTAVISDAVEELSGHKPKSIREFIKENKDALLITPQH